MKSSALLGKLKAGDHVKRFFRGSDKVHQASFGEIVK
jgi:hypothetical protein